MSKKRKSNPTRKQTNDYYDVALSDLGYLSTTELKHNITEDIISHYLNALQPVGFKRALKTQHVDTS